MTRHPAALILALGTIATQAQSPQPGPATAPTPAPPATPAASPTRVTLGPEDVYFLYRPVHAGSGLCGFQIRGNHFSRAIPRPEWDMNIDEIVQGDTHVAGVSAGTFQVVSKDERKPRPPITALTFTVDGNNEPVVAHIVGAPSDANALRAMVDLEPAARLFMAFYSGQRVTIALNYQDGAAELLEVRTLGDRRKFSGGQNNYFDECMRGIKPFTNTKHVVP
jgi:hypothetical protein